MELATKIETLTLEDVFNFSELSDESVDAYASKGKLGLVNDLVTFWEDLYRVMKPGAQATISVPFCKSGRAWAHPGTVRAFNEESFLILSKAAREEAKFDFGLTNANFTAVIVYENVEGHWLMKSEEARAFGLKHYWNVAHDLKVILTKV